MAKATGADITRFYDSWPMGADWYHDDTTIEITGDEGENLLDPVTKYDLDDFGSIIWQGSGPVPVKLVIEGVAIQNPDQGWISFAQVFKAWQKGDTTCTVCLTVPKDQVEALKALAKERGWKVA